MFNDGFVLGDRGRVLPCATLWCVKCNKNEWLLVLHEVLQVLLLQHSGGGFETLEPAPECGAINAQLLGCCGVVAVAAGQDLL